MIGFGTVRTAWRPLVFRDVRPVPGLLVFAPPVAAGALPELIDGVPLYAHPFSVIDSDDGRRRFGVPTVLITVYVFGAAVVALMCAWALMVGGKPWVSAVIGVGAVMPWLFGKVARVWAERRDGPVAYWLYGRFLYLRGAFGVLTADLHDPRVRVEMDLRLAIPGRYLPRHLAITAYDRRLPDEDLLALAAVLNRSPFADGRHAATHLLSRTEHQNWSELPVVPGLDTDATPLATAHLRRRPFLAAFFAGLQVAVVVAGLVAGGDSGVGVAWLWCLLAALLCGPLGYAAWLALTWGAPPKERTAGTP